MDEQYAYEQPSNGVEPVAAAAAQEEYHQQDQQAAQQQHQQLQSPDLYANGAAASNGSLNGAANGNGAASPAVIRKTLASWVGFSNLPNQVHRRSVR